MELGAAILEHLTKFSAPPYLFVGSGISRRYLGLEDWPGMLKNLCETHKLDYGYLRAESAGDLPLFATLAAKELQKVWWQDDRYADSRAEFAHVATNPEAALKIETAKYIKSAAKLTTDPALLAELNLFKDIVSDGIITTNWDTLMEELFPGHVVYVGQEGLIFSQIQGIAEIYKIHGTSNDPRSLILTQADYAEFQSKNPYLASKLITFFVENPVVFLGYSLTDANILSIIYSILDCLSKENILKLADRLVFIQWDENAAEARLERTILTHGGRSLPVFQGTTASMAGVLAALGNVRRNIPAKLLRILKKQVFDLVHSTNPGEKIYVKDIDETTPHNRIEFAMGVGILEKLRDVGYVALKRRDLVRDIIFGDQALKADIVVTKSLPELLKASKNVPIFKYLQLASEIPGFDLKTLSPRMKEERKRNLLTFRKTVGSGQVVEAAKNFNGDFHSFAEKNTFERTMAYWPYLKSAAFNPDQIYDFLVMHFDECIDHANANIKTSFFKLVCVYDYLRYGNI